MGYLLALLSAVFASAKDLVSKKLASGVSGTVSAFASFAFAIPFYLVLLAFLYALGFETFNFSFAFFTYALLRAIFDVGAEWSKMSAFTHGDISLLACIMSLYPIFLLIASPLITGDQVSSLGVVAVLSGVVGTLLLLYRKNMDLSHVERKGVALAFVTALCFGLVSCFDRLAVKIASPTLSGFAMTALSGLFLLPFAAQKQGAREELRIHVKFFTLRGFFEVSFMVIKLWALQYLQAPYVTCLVQVSLLFSIIGGKVLFKEEDFARRLIAGILIAGGAVMVLFA